MLVTATLVFIGFFLIDYWFCRLLESVSTYGKRRDTVLGLISPHIVFPLMSLSNDHANGRGLEYDTRAVLRDDDILVFLFDNLIALNGELI